MKLFLHQGVVKEFIETLEYRRGITATPTQTGPMRNPFQERDGNSMVQSCGETKSLRSLHTEIFRPCGKLRIIAGKRDLPTRPVGYLDLIGQRDRYHESLQLMEAIRAHSENTERNVDLGRCGECDAFCHLNPLFLIV